MAVCAANMRSCDPKKRCQIGPNKGKAYNPKDPCCGGGIFDEETCDCSAEAAYSLILRQRNAGFVYYLVSCSGRPDYSCNRSQAIEPFVVDSTEYTTAVGWTAPFEWVAVNDFQLPYYSPNYANTCTGPGMPPGSPLTTYPDLEGLRKASTKYNLVDAEGRIVLNTGIAADGWRGGGVCWANGENFKQSDEPFWEILHVNGPGLPVKEPGDFGGEASDDYVGNFPYDLV